MKQTPHGSQPNDPPQNRSGQIGMVLGFAPLLLWVAASVFVLIEGRCQPHTRSSLLALLALLLWGAEGVGGLLGLFVSRRRALAKALPLGILIAYPTFLAAFCFHITF